MMLKLLVEPVAEREFQAAERWYGERSPGLASAFREAVGTTLEHIERAPSQYPVALRDIRKARVLKFPYVVYFVPLTDIVVVIAIMHGRRNPKRWQGRH